MPEAQQAEPIRERPEQELERERQEHNEAHEADRLVLDAGCLHVPLVEVREVGKDDPLDRIEQAEEAEVDQGDLRHGLRRGVSIVLLVRGQFRRLAHAEPP